MRDYDTEYDVVIRQMLAMQLNPIEINFADEVTRHAYVWIGEFIEEGLDTATIVDTVAKQSANLIRLAVLMGVEPQHHHRIGKAIGKRVADFLAKELAP